VTTRQAGVVDTSIIAALRLYEPSELPDTMLITAITLGELSYGPHATDDPAKRAGRVAVLQHVEATFDPLPYDQGSARLYGQICAAVRAAGRRPPHTSRQPDDRSNGSQQRPSSLHSQPRRLQGHREPGRSRRRPRATQ
jgi:predicted nucleic acid-binding protein